ncbi:hypothetical protein MRB53_039549 [Persea americana]|nr:hypothetical protein MRB53_039549 [Persea americana]
MFYSFSFAINPKWSSLFPTGPEIVRYMHDVCRKFEITDKIQCNTDVESCVWLEDEQIWELTLKHMVHGTGDLSSHDKQKIIDTEGIKAVYTKTEKIRSKIVISCVGGLVDPRAWPEKVPGIQEFEGKLFHSARWRYDVDLKDKDVIVVGTGCSAAQFTPRLTKGLWRKERDPDYEIAAVGCASRHTTWRR